LKRRSTDGSGATRSLFFLLTLTRESEAFVIYTIGYGGLRNLQELIEIMDRKKIGKLVDVRSKPTAWCNYFKGSTISKALGERYEWVGDRLGGLGTAIEEKDIEALAKRNKGNTLLLMCSEKDPARCHRHYEIASRLLDYGVVAVHLVNLHEYPADKVPVQKGGVKWLS
jgi:uncharacterized protein (DUF488 family)